jgi:hypothetical protein
MSSIIVNAAAGVTPPGSVYVLASVAVAGPAEVVKLDTDDWNGKWISVQAEVDDAFVRFGTTVATATPDPAAVSAAAAPPATLAPAPDGCWHIPAGTTQQFYLRNFVTRDDQGIFMGHISNAAVAGGSVRFYRSSGPREL